jgi:hypothetical protein
VFALAQARATKVKAEYGPAKTMQRFSGMKDNFVVERAPKERMRMAHDGGVGGSAAANIEQGFEPSGRTFQRQRPDLRCNAAHAAMFSRTARRALF